MRLKKKGNSGVREDIRKTKYLRRINEIEKNTFSHLRNCRARVVGFVVLTSHSKTCLALKNISRTQKSNPPLKIRFEQRTQEVGMISVRKRKTLKQKPS